MVRRSPFEELVQYADDHEQDVIQSATIDKSLYQKYGVKRGLRDENGKGVLSGLTNISEIYAREEIDGKIVPTDGRLWYRGYDINDLVNGAIAESRYGFEEITYLLLFGQLPDKATLQDFTELMASSRFLPTNFVRDVIMKAPSVDMMNSLSRSVLTLASYDSNPSDLSVSNTLRQCLRLIAVFRCWLYTDITATITMSGIKACTSIAPIHRFRRRKTCCTCCGPICSTRSWKPVCWIWR